MTFLYRKKRWAHLFFSRKQNWRQTGTTQTRTHRDLSSNQLLHSILFKRTKVNVWINNELVIDMKGKTSNRVYLCGLWGSELIHPLVWFWCVASVVSHSSWCVGTQQSLQTGCDGPWLCTVCESIHFYLRSTKIDILDTPWKTLTQTLWCWREFDWIFFGDIC